MSVVSEGGFETTTGWTLTGGAAVETLPGLVYEGNQSLKLAVRGADIVAPQLTAQSSRSDVTVQAGSTYNFSAYLLPLSPDNSARFIFRQGGDVRKTVTVTPGSVTNLVYSQVTDTWVPGTSETLELAVRCAATLGTDISTWYVDVISLTVEDDMAIKLTERAIDAIVTCLQDNLGTEISAINTDRGDDITLTAPATGDYYKRPKSEIAGSEVHVEVFETAVSFDNPYTDVASARAAYRMQGTVRLTAFNRGDSSGNAVHTADDMMTMMRRYAAALFNAVTKNYRLVSPTDDALKLSVVEVFTPHWEISSEDEDMIVKVQCALGVEVVCEEVQ